MPTSACPQTHAFPLKNSYSPLLLPLGLSSCVVDDGGGHVDDDDGGGHVDDSGGHVDDDDGDGGDDDNDSFRSLVFMGRYGGAGLGW